MEIFLTEGFGSGIQSRKDHGSAPGSDLSKEVRFDPDPVRIRPCPKPFLRVRAFVQIFSFQMLKETSPHSPPVLL